jgi:hypothetical protein
MLESLAFVAMAASGPQDIPDSQYRGYHYEEKWEPVRKCLIWRESRGRIRADGSGGSGLYQFIQSTWDAYVDRAGYPEWKGVRPYKAPRYVQDEMFWLVINPKPKLKGLHGKMHWSVTHANVKIRGCFNE